jgi:hypothetical protein
VTGKLACRLCGSIDLQVVLSLGNTPLANALLTEEELRQPEAVYPLDLGLCRRCGLVQITETVPPTTLFSEYFYFSSFSDTMVRHAAALAGSLIKERRLGPTSLVVEAASNDGYLLQHYHGAGVPVLGIEPASNVAQVAEGRGIKTRCAFFSRELGNELRQSGIRADVFHAHNVLAHVPDLNGFVQGIGLVLREQGTAVLEVPYVKDMLDKCEFDTIYHEHLCYFSLTALDRLFKDHQLTITRVERVSIHGGSLRIHAVHSEGAAVEPTVPRLLEEEVAWGATVPDPYLRFAERVREIQGRLGDMLAELKAAGKRLAAYGAAAKGSTLLNSLPLEPGVIDFVVDRSTYKQGRYMPGVHLPIFHPDKLMADRPEYVLLLTWNFADEIFEQQKHFRQSGGRFVVPIPEPTIV